MSRSCASYTYRDLLDACRDDTKIYGGFGLEHLSNAIGFYKPKKWQKPRKSLIVYQPLAEAIVLFSQVVTNLKDENRGTKGAIYSSRQGWARFLDIEVPEDWRENGVVDKQVYRYKIFAEDMTFFSIGAYKKDDTFIEGDISNLSEYYKSLAYFCSEVSACFLFGIEIRKLIYDFSLHPSIETLVSIHAELYKDSMKGIQSYIAYEDASSFMTMCGFGDPVTFMLDDKGNVALDPEKGFPRIQGNN